MIVERSNDVIFREIDGEVIIITGDGRQMHMLNETASLIWCCTDRKTTVGEIVVRVCDHYEVDEATATRDVLATLESMCRKNLIKLVNRVHA